MEDLAERINSVLSDPESVKQLGEIARMLGFSPDPAPGDLQNAPAAAADIPDAGAILELAGKLKEAGGDDDNIRFLMALRPLLSEDKQPKIDRAVRLLKIINLLPVIRESGLLGGDLLGII